MPDVEHVEVVLASNDRVTLCVGEVFLKIDADQMRTDVEVEAMAMAPVPTPEVLWRKPPALALAAVPGRALGRLGVVRKDQPMNILRQVGVFEAADLGAESAFWAGVLGGRVIEDDDYGWRSVIAAGGRWRIGVQLAPDHVPPDWPDGTPKQQIHLDLHVDDPVGADDKVVSLGDRLLQAGDSTADEGPSGLRRSRRPPLPHRLGTTRRRRLRSVLAQLN